ncbi:unnamed protein product [Pylaiella littoralis]
MPSLVACAVAAHLLLLCSCRAAFALLPAPRIFLRYTTTMSGEQSPDNPFGEFALGVSPGSSSPRSAVVGGARPAAAALSTALDTNDDKVSNKRRVPAGATAAGQKKPKGLVEKYRSPGEPEWPLRVIIIGHNPSEKAWELGHYYGNPSNRMWKLLSSTGIVPSDFTASDDDLCPITSGVGFTDVGFSIPGTVSSEFGKKELHSWRQGFYDRLMAHAERAAATSAAATPAATEAAPNKTFAASGGTEETVAAVNVEIDNGYPKVIAFAGKRQWEELFFDANAKTKAQTKGGKAGAFRFGLQPATLRPPGWPFPAWRTEIFVLPSSSGAAAMTNESREAPYRALGEHISRPGYEWTRHLRNGGATSTGKIGVPSRTLR